MNTLSSHQGFKSLNWSVIIMAILGFWLSSSLVLDFVIVPGLSATGMMSQGGFASVGYIIFGIFNRIELLCAGLILSGFLIFRSSHHITHHQESWSIALASLLLMIAVGYTYILTPEMSSFALEMNVLNGIQMPQTMIPLHGIYWTLEVIKLLAGVTLLRWCYRDDEVHQ
jgi:hypothetical protein